MNSVFGYGWSHSLQHQFTFNDKDETIKWVDHQNLIITLPMPDKAISLSANLMAKTAVWLGEQEREYLFTSASLNGWVMHVKRLADNSGKITGFSQKKQHLHLHYDDKTGLPIRLENPAGASLLFDYIATEQGHRLAEIRLKRHITLKGTAPEPIIRYTYDERGQLSEAINPANEAERYTYRDDYVFSQRRLAGGAEFYWQWQGTGKAVRALRHWSNIPNTEIRYEWDDAAGTSTAIYADGSKEIWVHDKQSARQVKHISPSGATIERHYGQEGELLAEIDPLGNTTEYGYDGELNCVSVTYPDGRRLWQRFNRGLLMERIEYSADGFEKSKEKWEYDIDGQLLCYINPMQEELHYQWTEGGVLSAIRYGDETCERYTINALGQLLEYQSRSGEITYYRYNAMGKLVFESTTNPQQYGHEKQIDPLPATRLVWDDAGRLAAVRWPDGSSRKFSYNPYGGITKEVDEKQRETHYEYHDNTMLIKRIRYPDNSYSEYLYDNVHGEISDIINANGDHYHIDYTPSGKVKTEKLFDGRYIVWDYDANDQIIKRTEYGESRREETALITTYERDHCGRVIARLLPDGQKITYRYDGFGRLNEVDDGKWPLVWQYDKCGRITQEHQGFSSQYFDYDQAGRLFRMRMPDGNILTHYYRGDEVSQIDLNGQTLSTHRWQEGNEIARSMGRFGELNCHQQFDNRGRLLNQKVKVKDSLNKPIERHYQYNVAGELTQMTDNYKGLKTFTHDLKSRLSSASHQPYSQGQLPDELSYKGYHEHFYFDGADNLLGSEMPLDELKHASPAPKNNGTPKSPQTQNKLKANRLLIQGDRHYQYDEYGNVIRELRGKRQHTEHQFKWDGQHRLIEFKKIRHYWDEYDKDFHQTVETVHSYEYDAFGRRISKTDMQTGDKTLFFWLGDKLITECHADDADFSVEAIRNEHTKAQNYRCLSYIYEPSSTGFRPMAQLVGRGRGGQIYYYLNDQLGTPQELMTANGDIVWSGVYKSYGELAIEYRTVPQNLRFQGQYFDEESGLHYNRYRYYDPYTARYISQDPIGLAGGENAYSYVPNPLAWIDPLGLAKICPVREVNRTKIYGTGQVDGTPGHDQFSEVIANKLAMSGQFKEIYLNRSYNRALGGSKSTRRPDIMAIDKNGKVHAIEIASKSDMKNFDYLLTRNEEAMRILGIYREDAISSFKHPYNARDIKHRLDLLIKGIKEGN
ncbi:MAG: RHS domain-containing protein [Lactobacillus sp.]|nr:RHS domain-containing protein [Lactobacillus sp.]